MSTSANRPRVGVAVIVINDDKVLLGRRKGSHAAGTWAFPGGHLEFGEEPEQCAQREVSEETGISITNIRRSIFTNDVFDKEKHYITLFLLADHKFGEPSVREPEKCEEWGWFAWDALPRPLMLPIEHLLQQGYSPFNDALSLLPSD